MKLQPGPRYLLSSPGLFLPPFALWLTRLTFDFVWIPTWLWTLVLLTSPFTFFALKWYINSWRHDLAARRHGAIRPPLVPTKWPGSTDIVYRMFQLDKKAYLGEFMWAWGLHIDFTYRWNLFWEDMVITSDPDHVKAMLATDFNNWEKGSALKYQMQSLLGDGVFNSDGEMWKFHRSMTRPFFSKERISHFEIFGRHADEAIELMKTRLRSGHAIDFQDVVSRFTLDSATEFLFGNCMNYLSAGLPYSPNLSGQTSLASDDSSNPGTMFAHAFNEAQIVIARRSRFGVHWPLREFWGEWLSKYTPAIDSFVDPIIKAAVERKKNSDNGGMGQTKREKGVSDDEETLLGHLVNYTEDLSILKDETLNIMLAGRDTTAATLTFVMYMLAQNPEVLKRLRTEILATIGSRRRPTYDDLREMKYLRAVINETLRLYPPVPFNQRSCKKATVWPNRFQPEKPYYLTAGTRCMYSVFGMHRRTDLWGPDAHKFDPDRFIDSRLHTYLTPNPFIFLPFNAGPRICLGQQFAYNEVSYMLIRLLQSFETVELAQDEQPHFSKTPDVWTQGMGNEYLGDFAKLDPEAKRDRVAIGMAEGWRWRKAREKVWPKSHLTMYALGGLWLRLHEAPADLEHS